MSLATIGGGLPPSLNLARLPDVTAILSSSTTLAELHPRCDISYPGIYDNHPGRAAILDVRLPTRGLRRDYLRCFGE